MRGTAAGVLAIVAVGFLIVGAAVVRGYPPAPEPVAATPAPCHMARLGPLPEAVEGEHGQFTVVALDSAGKPALATFTARRDSAGVWIVARGACTGVDSAFIRATPDAVLHLPGGVLPPLAEPDAPEPAVSATVT